MIIHHTKTKGDLGLLKAKADVCQQGYLVLSVESEHMPFDFVAYKDKKFYRIQVKYRTVDGNGRIHIDVKGSWRNKDGLKKTEFDKSEVDVICAYCPDLDKCYYVPSCIIGSTSIDLRVRETKNKQTKVHMAADFESLDNALVV